VDPKDLVRSLPKFPSPFPPGTVMSGRRTEIVCATYVKEGKGEGRGREKDALDAEVNSCVFHGSHAKRKDEGKRGRRRRRNEADEIFTR
jgi:hypothetical protein